MMALLMSQLQPVLTALNRSLEHLGQQVGALGRDVAALQSNQELDRVARQLLDAKLEQVSEQITDIRTQIETEQRDTDDRLLSLQATLQHNITSLTMDVDLKLDRHQKMLQVRTKVSKRLLTQRQTASEP